jgi:hypothetical protein
MAIKLAVIKTGEQIISKVEEMVHEDRVVGYFMIKPCIVSTSDPKVDPETKKASFDINLTPWIPLGKGIRFPVPLEWIVTFVDPVDALLELYQKDVLKESDTEDQSIIIPDEGDS